MWKLFVTGLRLLVMLGLNLGCEPPPDNNGADSDGGYEQQQPPEPQDPPGNQGVGGSN